MVDTIKEKIQFYRIKQDKEEKESNKRNNVLKRLEAQELVYARESIRQDLAGFDVKEEKSVFGNFFAVSCNRTIYIVYAYKNCKVRYTDEMDEVDERRLCISIGFSINQSECGASVKNFADILTDFLIRNNLA